VNNTKNLFQKDYFMKKTVKSTTSLLVVALLIAQPAQAYNDDATNFGVALATVGVAVLAVGGAIWAFSEESIDSIEQKTGRVCNKADSYDNDIRLIKRTGCLNNPSAINEEDLYQVTSMFLKKNSSARSYISNAKEVLNDLISLEEVLTNRAQKLQYDRSVESLRTMERLRTLDIQVVQKKNPLKKLVNFCQEHSGYMYLFEKEADLYKKYDGALTLLNQYGSSMQTAHLVVRELASSLYSTKRYPYMHAHETLKSNIKHLRSVLSDANAYRYPQRTSWARWLLDKLTMMETMLISSAEIQQDRSKKEYDRLCKELEREREKAEREQRKAEQAARELRQVQRDIERTLDQERYGRRDTYSDGHITITVTK
jgi:hypothetical protein